LTDNKGKACILLEELDRYTLWGKIRPEQLKNINSAIGDRVTLKIVDTDI
jgi:hypothetical protein